MKQRNGIETQNEKKKKIIWNDIWTKRSSSPSPCILINKTERKKKKKLKSKQQITRYTAELDGNLWDLRKQLKLHAVEVKFVFFFLTCKQSMHFTDLHNSNRIVCVFGRRILINEFHSMRRFQASIFVFAAVSTLSFTYCFRMWLFWREKEKQRTHNRNQQ